MQKGRFLHGEELMEDRYPYGRFLVTSDCRRSNLTSGAYVEVCDDRIKKLFCGSEK